MAEGQARLLQRSGLRFGLGLGLLLALGAALRAPHLGDALLEGAAGKQTHTAMVARNLYRGRSSWLRPMVDDVGRPGYFVKELPLVPGVIALAYGLAGGVHEWFGRLLGAAAWLAAVPLLVGLLRRDRGTGTALLAGFWYVLAPLGIVYSRSFMNDPVVVATSLATLAAMLAWQRQPSLARALATGVWLALSLLLKAHAALWLAPALAVVALAGQSNAAARAAASAAPSRRRGRGFPQLFFFMTGATALAATWYLHAAAVHRAYPVPGATVARGWLDPGLWLRPELYAIVARQELAMVLTPLGAVLAVAGLVPPRPAFSLAERALLGWGGGVLLQCVLLATRMFDERSRGTEYYQLAAVPVASLLVARGVERAAALFSSGPRRRAATALLLVGLAAGAVRAAGPVLETPARYGTLLDDCVLVRELTRPDQELLVLADRGGTVLYYCDRRGTTLAPAAALDDVARGSGEVASAEDLARALGTASYLYLPFPEMVTRAPQLDAWLEREWQRIPTPGRRIELYARRVTTPGGAAR